MLKNVIRCATNFGKVESQNIFRFINEYEIQVNNDQLSDVSYIPLHFLREVYLTDKALFFRLVKEFGLRGYEIIADNNDLFYKNIIPFDKWGSNRMLHTNSSDKYSWRDLVLPPSIQTFLDESNVKSSKFFDGMLVSNLFKVFPGTDESLLVALSRIGVVISDCENSATGQLDEGWSMPSSTVEKKQCYIVNLFDSYHNPTIVNALEENGIETTADITYEKLQRVFETKGIGEKKKALIQETIKPYLDDSLQYSGSHKERNNYIKIFPEIIFHSYLIRRIFANNFQIELRCTEYGQVSDRDLKILNLSENSKRYKTLKKMIEKDISLYLGYVNEHVKSLLGKKQVNWIISNFEFSDELLKAINHFTQAESQEFYQELNYELSFSLDKRLNAVESEIAKSVFKKKHWSVIERIIIKKPKATLQEIGDEVGLTRERVRQIIINMNFLKANLAEDYRINQFLCLSYFEKDQPLIFIDKLNSRLIELLKDTQSQLIIQPNNKDSTPFIILNQEKETLAKVNNWVDKLQNENKLNIDALWNFFRNFSGSRPEKIFKKCFLDEVLKTYHYKYVFSNTAYKNMSKAKIVYHIYFERFGNNFSISDLPFSTLNEEYRSVSGDNLFSSNHKRDSEDLINNMLLRVSSNTPGILYIGGRKYEDDPSGKINDDFWLNVKSFILESLQEVVSIKINKVYSHFQSYLNKVGIVSPQELYFILKEHLSEFVSFSEGNEFSIWKMNVDKISNEQILTDLIVKNGNEIEESDIIEKLGWTSTSIEQTAYNSSNLVYVKGKIYYKDWSIPSEIREFISNEISKQTAVHSNYLLVRPIQQHLRTHWELLEKIPDIEILENLNVFTGYVKAIDHVWRGYSQVLYKKDSVDVSTILNDRFGNKPFDKDQYNNFLEYLGYKASTINLKLSELISNNVIAKVGPENFIFTKFLNIRAEDQLRIDNYLLEMLGSNERYISLALKIVNGPILPKISDLVWTRELLFYFASRSSAVKVLNWPQDTNVTSFPINPMIIVNRNDTMNSLLDLTKYCIENFEGNRSVVNVKNYLFKKGILVGKASKEKLPEILNPILFVDNDNVVHLKNRR